MRILVFGAAGRTGRHVVEQALGHGHLVRAFVRSSPLAIDDPGVEIFWGDVRRFEDVEPAVVGCDAVVFAVGPGRERGAHVHEEGIGHVLHAMALHDVRALSAMSAAGAFARTDPRIPFAFRALMATVLKPVMDDLEAMERRIAASGVEWTVVRAGGLTDGPQTGVYRLSRDGSPLPKAGSIARADVAAVLLKAVEGGAFARQTLLVAG